MRPTPGAFTRLLHLLHRSVTGPRPRPARLPGHGGCPRRRPARALARRAPRIVSREELSSAVWEHPLREGDRSIDVYVHKLRSKLESALPHWQFIHTHVGFGYRFDAVPLHGFHIPATTR